MLPFAAVRSVRRYVPVAVTVAATFAIAAPATAVAGGCANADANPNDVSASVAQRATLCLLNAERRAHHLRRLRENIAWGSLDWATPRAIMRSWMNSPPHRANILNRSFRDIGIGVARGAPVSGVSNAATYVTDFGARG